MISDKIESEMDYNGACKICKCETLGGHYINCFIYKKEQEIKALQDEVKSLKQNSVPHEEIYKAINENVIYTDLVYDLKQLMQPKGESDENR